MRHKIDALFDTLGPELDEISRRMYEHPELGGEETLAARLHTDLLRKYGFTVEQPYCGLPTGFLASFDSGKPGPVIAYLSEYDALPGVGHGCGHNIHGAASTGAGIALSRLLPEIGGRVLVYGTPAEETNGAKILYAERGAFSGVDAAMMLHSSDEWLRSGSSLALQPLEFEFFGKAAHASSCPELGINALDAGLVTMTAINALREHMLPTSRVHGIVVNGGDAPNIVPDYCRLRYYVRSRTVEENEPLVERIVNCAKAGALATGATLRVNHFEIAFPDLRTNETLCDAFCEVANREYGVVITEKRCGGATDAAAVSRVCPTIHGYFDIVGAVGTTNSHSREHADATVTPFAQEQMRKAVVILALTGARLIEEPALLENVRTEFFMQNKLQNR